MKIDTSKYKDRLEEQKKSIESELGSIAVKDVNNPNSWDAARIEVNDDEPSDRTETASEITEFEENSSIASNLDVQLIEIDSALDRIENGTYGVCKVCNSEIELDRLDANPSASTCKEHMNG
jgi:RNA polymerase-binding transcription factor DksA